MPKFEVFTQRTMIQQSIFYQPPSPKEIAARSKEYEEMMRKAKEEVA